MPVTLAQAKVDMQDKVAYSLIDTLQVSSDPMSRLTFDDTASAQGGSTLTYSYNVVSRPASAQGRKINQEYTPQEAERGLKTAKLTISGGSYQIDRVIARTSARFLNEVEFQNAQKIKAVANRFNYMFINGDYDGTASTDSPEFDGLKKLLEGTDSNLDCASINIASITTASAKAFVNAMNKAIAENTKSVDVIYCSVDMQLKIIAIAQELGYYSNTTDEFGRVVERYRGIPIVDLGKYYNGSTTVDIIPANEIYLCSFGLDALHGATPEGGNGIGLEYHLPNYNEAGAVKKGDVESVAGLVLKDTTTCKRLHSFVIA